MPLIANSVFDAALGIVDNCNKAKVVTSGSVDVITSITLDASNFGAITDNSGAGAGRKIQCLVSSASDMKAISVDTSGGAAKKIQLLISSAVTVVASLTSAVSLGASDQVNLGTFSVILKDPT